MTSLKTAGLFAGIGGIELGLQQAGHHTELLCEYWDPAAAVLRARFDAPVHPDVRTLRSLPSSVELVTAGFPCQDLSQAGRTAGIHGDQSSLVDNVFRLLRRRHPSWVLLENVSFMLQLDRGKAMRHLVDELEAMKYRWAYRIIDSRSVGVPQRRRRVLFLASRLEDPRTVLFPDDAGEPEPERYTDDAFGFYWTEGLRGLGWAVDAVPTMKGGSTVGIPSPPAIWVPGAKPGRQFVLPSIEEAEALQGFARGWTQVTSDESRNGPRWKLVGNAVTVGVAEWVGQRLAAPGTFDAPAVEVTEGAWPTAAYGEKGRVFKVALSEYPIHAPYPHLTDIVDVHEARALSHRATAGFLSRAEQSGLRFVQGFLADVALHLRQPVAA